MPPSTSHPPLRRSGAFELETEFGTRRLEFDPDVFRGRDVRILVDGARVADLPFPKPASPYQEISFELDDHKLVGATWLLAESSAAGVPLCYDLFADGRSLTDGSSLAEVRVGASTPRAPYPRSFHVLDMVLRIAPAAATPGLAVGVGRGAAELGWQRAILLLALMLVAVVMATALGSRGWQRIRAAERQSVRRRAALGWAAVLSSYAVAFVVMLALAVLLSG